jgi:hypothetical protein
MLRVGLENTPVEREGFVDAAGAMMLQRFGEGRRERRRGACRRVGASQFVAHSASQNIACARTIGRPR